MRPESGRLGPLCECLKADRQLRSGYELRERPIMGWEAAIAGIALHQASGHDQLMNEHELGFLSFLDQRSERRLRALWEAGPRRRDAAREYLAQANFDHQFVHPLNGPASSFAAVEKQLKQRGAPQACFVIARDKELDGQELPLLDAIFAASGAFEATFLSCLPGKLGFFEGPGIKSASLIFRS